MTEGATATDTYCAGCGERRVPGKAFCANCGRSFADASDPAASTVAVTAPSAQGLSRVSGADLAVLGGAALLIAAPFFPFITATAALVGSISRNGIELTSGEALVISAVGVIAGLLALRSLGQAMGRVPILLGLVGLGLTFYYYLQVDDRVQGVDTDYGFASIGAGIWMAFAGAVLVVVGSLVAKPPEGMTVSVQSASSTRRPHIRAPEPSSDPLHKVGVMLSSHHQARAKET